VRGLALPVLTLALLLPACGGGASSRAPNPPFVAGNPDLPVGPAPTPVPLPPPTFPRSPVWTETAYGLGRTASFGSFPSDLVAHRGTLFTTDADQVEASGATVVPIDVGGATPETSRRFAPTTILPADLFDSAGNPFDPDAPIGFGAFVNDLAVAGDDVAFALVNAGGSDSDPALSNLVVLDPTRGAVVQVLDLATLVPTDGRLDSTGAPVPGPTFRQSQAEGVAFVPTDGADRGRLFVAMANIVFGPPSYGAVKYPGTVQVFDVDLADPSPVRRIPAAGVATRTLVTHDFNPVAVTRLDTTHGGPRVFVTNAGTTAYDASFRLRPVSPASIEVLDPATLDPLGRFELGLVGLAGNRPAVGRDAAGHRVAFFASSVLGEVYLLRLDGVVTPTVDPSRVAVVRGAGNPIPIDPDEAGGPGGNVAGLGLASDGRTLVVSGFGDLFAFPVAKPGRLLALSLPADLVDGEAISGAFVPGTTAVATTPGRTLGGLVVGAFHEDGPEVFVAVSGTLSPTTFLGTGPASLGTLRTFGRIR
jgi:hypothetical protein